MPLLGADTQVVVFDCDGVLLDSNSLKVRIFGEVAASAGLRANDVEAFRKHVRANFGTSRYALFGWLAEQHVLGLDVVELVRRYAERLFDSYVSCPVTPGMETCLQTIATIGLPMFVVSGSEQSELRRMMAARGLDSYFSDIYGSPIDKMAHIRSILRASGLEREPSRLTFVGDAEADWKAAATTSVRFIYMDSLSTARERMRELQLRHGFAMVDDLRTFAMRAAA